jgi:hypothetical protein
MIERIPLEIQLQKLGDVVDASAVSLPYLQFIEVVIHSAAHHLQTSTGLEIYTTSSDFVESLFQNGEEEGAPDA